MRSSTSGAGFIQIATVSKNVTSFDDTGLSPGTDYYYVVKAFNDDGDSDYTNELAVTTIPLQPPATPTNLSSSDVLKNSLYLSWIDNSDNEDGYIIEQALAFDSIFVQVATVDPDITSCSVNGLTPDKTYYYRIIAFNEDGNSEYSNMIAVKTLPLRPPQAPSSLDVSDVTKNTITLIWSDNSDNEYLEFNVEPLSYHQLYRQ